MKCNDSRKINYLAEYPQVVTEDMLEAKRHASECRECREFFEGEKSFGALLRNAVKREPLPEELRNKILNSGKTIKTHFKPRYRIFAVAASILIIAIAGYMYSTYTKSHPILEKIVNDHVKFLPVPQMHVKSSNPNEIREWFRGNVNFPVLPPSISATLKGGRLCILDKKHFALLFYEHSGSPVSVFITDGNVPDDLKTKKEVIIQDKKAYVLHRRGYTILLWEDRGLIYSLVTEMDVKEIKKIF